MPLPIGSTGGAVSLGRSRDGTLFGDAEGPATVFVGAAGIGPSCRLTIDGTLVELDHL
ncbi:MAG: hypothetical protein HY717_19775 [Planctomycetes bacterium]|nr:hypothetical protein [Planctomycetota bacterium]